MNKRLLYVNVLKKCLGFGLAVVLLLASCSHMRPQLQPVKSPIVRIGLVPNAEEIRFQPESRIYITTKESGDRYRSEQTDIWTVRINKGSLESRQYRLQFGRYRTKAEAREKIQELKEKGIESEINQIGDELWFEGKTISGTILYQVLETQSYPSLEDAEKLKRTAGYENTQVIGNASALEGEIILISPKGDELAVKNAVRLSGSPFTIHNVKVGEGFHWSRQESRSYHGELEFRINSRGGLSAINVLPLEDYLQGVLPGEMSATFPLEALKAQAIAARTFFLYNFGRVHTRDPFDACADVHCQVYVGTKNQHEKIEKAVRETRGLVLIYDDELCSTPFSALCGGHTENVENVWSGDPQPFLKGVFDMEYPERVRDKFDLSREQNVRTWIESMPDVFCNIKTHGDPSYASYARAYFRWQVSFTQEELSRNIIAYTNVPIGELLELKVVSRGVSGRIIELHAIGSQDSAVIRKELNIRKAMSPTTLYSACFVVDRLGDPQHPEFVIKGAGWGHGVGMCQIGAAIMAEENKNAGEILSHYYTGTKVRRLY